MTKRNSSRKQNTKRPRNPLRRSQRIKRPVMSFNGQSINSTAYIDQGAISTNVGIDWSQIGADGGESMGRSASDVYKHYQNYKFIKAAVEFIPRIGPSNTDAGSRVSVAYIDNPELVTTFYNTGSAAVRTGIVRSAANVRTYNAWERFTYHVPLTFRRKWFNVDVNQPAIGVRNAEETERSTQGLVVFLYETVSATLAAAALGTWRFNTTMVVSGFTASTLT